MGGCDCYPRGADPVEAAASTLDALCEALDFGVVSVAELKVITELVRGGQDLPEAVSLVKDAANGVITRSR